MFFLPSPPSSISFPGSNASVLFCSLLICRCFVRGLTSGWSYSRLLFGVRQLWRQHLFIVVALDSLSNILDKGTMSRLNLTWRLLCDSSWSLGLFAVNSLVLIAVLIPRISSPNLGCCRHSCVSPVRSVAAAAVVFSFFGLGPSYWLRWLCMRYVTPFPNLSQIASAKPSVISSRGTCPPILLSGHSVQLHPFRTLFQHIVDRPLVSRYFWRPGMSYICTPLAWQIVFTDILLSFASNGSRSAFIFGWRASRGCVPCCGGPLTCPCLPCWCCPC